MSLYGSSNLPVDYEQSENSKTFKSSEKESSCINLGSSSPLNYQDLLNEDGNDCSGVGHSDYKVKSIVFESSDNDVMHPGDTALMYPLMFKASLEENKERCGDAFVNHRSHTEYGSTEKADMAQPEETQCNLTIQDFMDKSASAMEVLTQLGHKVDPNNLKQSQTWKGFAKDKLKYDNSKIIATAYHTKGNSNNGHFMSLLEDMVAHGLTIGDIVEYYAREESKRYDVLNLILTHHQSCPFCDKYRKLFQKI